MKKIKIKQAALIALLLLTHSFSLAKEPDQTADILDMIEELNTSDFSINNMQCKGSCIFNLFSSSKKTNKLSHQCMVDICGPPGKNPRFVLNNTNFAEVAGGHSKNVLAQFDQDLAPAIKKGLARRREHYKKALDDLENIKTALNSDPAHPDWGTIAYNIVNSYSSVPLGKNGVQTRVIIEDLSNEPKKKRWLDSYLKMENTLRAKIEKEVKKQSISDLRESIKNQIQTLLADYENIDPSALTARESLEVRTLENFYKKSAEPNRALVENIAVIVGGMLSAKELIQAECGEECKQIVREELALFQKGVANMATISEETDDSTFLNECKSNFIEHSSAMKYTQTFRENLPQYKEKIIETGFARYSLQSRQQFENYMQNTLQIDMPRMSIEKEFIDNMNSTSSSLTSSFGSYVSFNDLRRSISDPKINQICPVNSGLQGLSDVYRHDQHKINLSFTSCALHNHGKGILAHEIGHAISSLFRPENKEVKMSERSYSQYQELRACATKRYKRKTLNPTVPESRAWSHKNDRLRTEEDTADLFSHMVFQDDPTHYQCALLGTSTNKDGIRYIGLDVLYKSEIADPHSTPVFRVLMEAIHKRKKLSSACQKIVRKYKNKINFTPCF